MESCKDMFDPIPKGVAMLIVTPYKMHLDFIYFATSLIVISLNYPLDLLYL